MPNTDKSNLDKDVTNRYVNDLRRLAYTQSQVVSARSLFVLIGIALLFLLGIASAVLGLIVEEESQALVLVAAAVIGGYMAMNIGANDVANNMGPAVGGKVLTVTAAVIIAVICETAGAFLAGGDVVETVAKGIVSPGAAIDVAKFQFMMLSALLAAALWINLATMLNAPVSTTHSIVGGVLGGGIAAAGFSVVNWATMSKIAASWIISPMFGGIVAALLLFFIKRKIFNVPDRLSGARRWVPILIGLMGAAFTAYMSIKGLKKIMRIEAIDVVIFSVIAFFLAWFLSRPYIARCVAQLPSASKKDIYTLFNLPLIIGVALLSFAHGANDVANAVGPLAAIVSTLGDAGAGGSIASSVGIPIWVMVVGALGIALGLALFGPKLIATVGEKITRLNSPRAYCVALSSAITVLIATYFGLPVSSTHIAIGAIFGVGFLREFMESPKRKTDAIDQHQFRKPRQLVRRRFVLTIAAAWVITVPASALLSGVIYTIIINL
ncbi:MAG: inorganic phosphate transporter [Candidatus Puniceispirillales bacterium WSBS_2018_MAG_OTU23]